MDTEQHELSKNKSDEILPHTSSNQSQQTLQNRNTYNRLKSFQRIHSIVSLTRKRSKSIANLKTNHRRLSIGSQTKKIKDNLSIRKHKSLAKLKKHLTSNKLDNFKMEAISNCDQALRHFQYEKANMRSVRLFFYDIRTLLISLKR